MHEIQVEAPGVIFGTISKSLISSAAAAAATTTTRRAHARINSVAWIFSNNVMGVAARNVRNKRWNVAAIARWTHPEEDAGWPINNESLRSRRRLKLSRRKVPGRP